MNLQIYDNSKTNLTPISFINDLPNQVKIRDIDTDSQEFRGQLGLLFTKISNLLGIKNKIDSINKKDIVDLLLMKYKSFSLEEIDYCFKLERFNSLGEKTQHFQLINSEYVSSVLDKYMNWKQFNIKNHIKQKPKTELMELPKDEKLKITKLATEKQLQYFLKYRKVDTTRLYIYDVFDKIGLMPTDIEYKKSVHKDAIEILKNQYENKRAKSKAEYKEIKNVFNEIIIGKGNEIKKKCKELALEDFLRKEIKQESDIERLINKI